ncbi:hypothetical protein [Streptomyces sp. NPDC001930]|uniref:hypothetical protein n=1 Tax=Streptomyces sp. NPDC001930 TaxID=3364625 RepID=UPI003675D142
MVFLDARPCSLAAVRRALPLVSEGEVLQVVLVRPRVPLAVALGWSQGVFVPDIREDLTRDVFSAVAALVAPTCLPWDFLEADHRVRPGASPVPLDAGAPGSAVVVRHQAGPLHLPFDRNHVQRIARTWPGGAGDPLVVPCDHRATAPNPARLNTTWTRAAAGRAPRSWKQGNL